MRGLLGNGGEGGGCFWGMGGSVESAGVRFSVLDISIRTPMPKQHKLEKRLDERERNRERERQREAPGVGHSALQLL